MKTPKVKPVKIEIPNTPEFQNLVNLLAVFTDASNQLKDLENRANSEMLEYLDEIKIEYANLQEVVSKAEAAVLLIAQAHPEWFGDKKSLATPYGAVSSKSSTKLEVANEEVSILKIKLAAEKAKDTPNRIDTAAYIRQKEELNLEALEQLPDEVLALYGITRVTKSNWKVKPAALTLGQAVKAESAEQPEQQAA